MNRKFGQNFLVSSQSRSSIVCLISPDETSLFWEIGPGLGSITALMLKAKAHVRAFEIDNGFCRILRELAFPDEENFSLVQGDALKTLFREKKRPDVIYGNLPYNVGSVCIAKLIENSLLPSRMVFTLQKEVVSRMTARAGDPDYSSFSLLTQLDYENSLELTLSKGCFYPKPNVESAVVLMKKRETDRIDPSLRPIFIPLVRDLFAQRRKNIRNNLLSGMVGKRGGKSAVEEVITLSGFCGTERAETFSFEEIGKIAAAAKEVLQL